MSTKIKLAAAEGEIAKPALRKAGKANGGGFKKFTLRISGELDYRLSSIAMQQGCTKADLALRFIESGTEPYGVNDELRAIYAKLMAKANEVARRTSKQGRGEAHGEIQVDQEARAAG